MKPGLRFERVTLEALAAALVGAGIIAALYSNWWSSCCKAASTVASLFLLPGLFVGMLIGGGPHGAGRVHYYIGVAVEFFLLWVFVRLFVMQRLRRPSAHDE